MDKNQKLVRPEPMAQQPGGAETHVTPPLQPGKAERYGAPEKNA